MSEWSPEASERLPHEDDDNEFQFDPVEFEPHGIQCPYCEALLTKGNAMRRHHPDDMGGPPIYELLCVDCMVRGEA